MKPTIQKKAEFGKLAEPLMKWLNENYHPHHTIIITPTNAELLEGQVSHSTLKYVKD